jgi:hypothetical protein
MILCTGFYNRNNLGDDIFYIIFNSIFSKLDIKYHLIGLDDCDKIMPNITTIILGGGEILNKYFLYKLQKLIESSNFNGTIIAYSCELPIGEIIPEVNLIDRFILRNQNDVKRLKTHFNSDKYIEYLPDIICSLPKNDFTNKTISKPHVTVCLARSIYKNNSLYLDYLKKIVLFLKFINNIGYTIYLLPFNTSDSNSESDLLINKDIYNLCNLYNFNVINIIPKSKVPCTLLKDALNTINSSEFTICSRYHAHILSMVCNKPILSIPHTKKAYEQMITFGLEKWMIRPTLDNMNRPTDFDVTNAIKLFMEFKDNYINIKTHIKNIMHSQQILTLEQHSIKIKSLIYKKSRSIPPYYVSNKSINNMINESIEKTKNKFNIKNFTDKQDNDITERVTRYILYLLCDDCDSLYYWGLSQKIFKFNFDYINEFKWIYQDYHSKNRKFVFTYDTLSEKQPNKNKILNLTYIKPHLLENIHRSGWYKVFHNTGILHNENGIIFDMFLDKTLHWGEKTYTDLELLPYNKPWIGIVHHTPNEYYTNFNTTSMIQKDTWTKSLNNCIGIYTMSNWLTNWFKKQIPEINVETLIHPTETPNLKFDFNKFINNNNKKVIQVGGWLRNIYSIYRINVPNNFQKAHLIGKNMENYIKPSESFEKIFTNNTPNSQNLTFQICTDNSTNKYIYFMNEYIKESNINDMEKILELVINNHNSVLPISTLSNQDYDELLSQNIIFIDLIELSACNTLLECIVRNTPILIKPLEPVIERLGINYPMYWTNYEDINELLTVENIKKTYKYLKNLDKSCYSYQSWINSIIKSNIFKYTQELLFPIQFDNKIKINKNIENIVETKENINNNIGETKENINNNIVETKENINNNIGETKDNINNNIVETKDNINNNIIETKENENQIKKSSKSLFKKFICCYKLVH